MNRKELLRDIMALDQAIDEFLGDLRTRASWDRSNIEDDGTVVLPCGIGVLHRLGNAREQLGKHVPLLATPAPPVDETDRLEPLIEQIASDVERRIASEFKGFWAPEDLIEEIPGMIREAGRALADRTQEVLP